MDDRELGIAPFTPKTPVAYSFFDAITFVMDDKRITRKEWNNPEIYGHLGFDSQYNCTILQLHKEDGKNYQWIISESDMLGDDYIVLEDKNV